MLQCGCVLNYAVKKRVVTLRLCPGEIAMVYNASVKTNVNPFLLRRHPLSLYLYRMLLSKEKEVTKATYKKQF